ncbi:MAG: hypothetical protein J5534_12655 [Fibrobacter sp.]|nr:hypothetical protein [Fibrobacter sp.]
MVHVPPISTSLLVGLTNPPVPAVTVSILVCLKVALIVQSPLTVIEVLFEFLSVIEQFPLPDEKVQLTNLYEVLGVAVMLTLEPAVTTFEPEGDVVPPVGVAKVSVALADQAMLLNSSKKKTVFANIIFFIQPEI